MAQYRQGDIWFETIDDIDSNDVRKAEDGRIILARGEATGHHHSIIADGKVMAFNGPNGEVLLDVTEHTEVTHQEHDPIPLAPDKYRTYRQREYTPEAIRNVAD